MISFLPTDSSQFLHSKNKDGLVSGAKVDSHEDVNLVMNSCNINDFLALKQKGLFTQMGRSVENVAFDRRHGCFECITLFVGRGHPRSISVIRPQEASSTPRTQFPHCSIRRFL